MASKKLIDLPVNTEFVIEASIHGESITFDTSVKYVKKGGLIIDPVRYNGKIVNLRSPNLSISVIYNDGKGVPIVWKDCVVRQIIYRNKLQHFITCISESSAMNRRASERVKIGASGRATGKVGNVFVANVHDLSETGFSIVTSHEINNYVNYPLKIKFDDGEMNAHFNLKGKVVRMEKLDDNLYLYGCELAARVTALSTYILQKRRMEKVYDLSKKRSKK